MPRGHSLPFVGEKQAVHAAVALPARVDGACSIQCDELSHVIHQTVERNGRERYSIIRYYLPTYLTQTGELNVLAAESKSQRFA